MRPGCRSPLGQGHVRRVADDDRAQARSGTCAPGRMIVPMMDVRIVRMRMRQRLVAVPVDVGFARRHTGRMRVLVMRVVPMRVAVLEHDVRVHVLVPLAQVQQALRRGF